MGSRDKVAIQAGFLGSQPTHYSGNVAMTDVANNQVVQPVKKKRRIFLWVFLAVQVLFIIWIIAGANSGSGQPSDCGSLSAKACNNASDAGTAIGVVLIIVVWFFVDAFMGVIYGVYRLARRT
jgi:hypothetical protein